MDLSINPNTIQRAYMQLEQDGYIYTIVGRGNYVTDRTEWQKGYQVAARQELSESLAKAKSSGLTLEDVLSMARQCYAGEAGTPPGDGLVSGNAATGNGIAAASGNALTGNASTTSKEDTTE